MYKTVIIVEDSKEKMWAIREYIEKEYAKELYPAVRFEWFWSLTGFIEYMDRMRGAMKRYTSNYLVIMDLYFPKSSMFPDQVTGEGWVCIGYMRRKVLHVDAVICATQEEIDSALPRRVTYSNLLGYIVYNQETGRLYDNERCIENKKEDHHS